MDLQPQDEKNVANQHIPEIEAIIPLVEQRPIIWYKYFEGYRNKELRNVAWNEICQDLRPGPNSFNHLTEEAKKDYKILVKKKWNRERDLWQKMHKKRKEAIQNGEQVKENPRYDRLKFLSKNDRDDLNTGNEKVFNQSIESPQSPEVDEDENDDWKHIGDCPLDSTICYIDFQENLKCQEPSSNTPSKFRKPENIVNLNNPMKHKQCSTKTFVDFDDKLNVGNIKSGSKHQSSVYKTEKNKFTGILSVKQSPKGHKRDSNPMGEELPSHSSNHSSRNYQNVPKVDSKYPNQLTEEDEETILNPSVSHINISEVQSMNGLKRRSSEEDTDFKRKKGTADEEVVDSIELFLQYIKPRVNALESKMVDFFYPIVKSLTKDFDESSFQNFEIATLKLLKNPMREELPSHSSNHSSRNYQNVPKVDSKYPNQLTEEDEETILNPSVSHINISEVQSMNGLKRRSSEEDTDFKRKKGTADEEVVDSIELFLQYIKPRVNALESKMVDFFYPIVKSLTKDFDKSSFQNFEIATLELLKKTEGN